MFLSAFCFLCLIFKFFSHSKYIFLLLQYLTAEGNYTVGGVYKFLSHQSRFSHFVQTVGTKALNNITAKLSALSREWGMSRPQLFFFLKYISSVGGGWRMLRPLFFSKGLLRDGKGKVQRLQEVCVGEGRWAKQRVKVGCRERLHAWASACGLPNTEGRTQQVLMRRSHRQRKRMCCNVNFLSTRPPVHFWLD